MHWRFTLIDTHSYLSILFSGQTTGTVENTITGPRVFSTSQWHVEKDNYINIHFSRPLSCFLCVVKKKKKPKCLIKVYRRLIRPFSKLWMKKPQPFEKLNNSVLPFFRFYRCRFLPLKKPLVLIYSLSMHHLGNQWKWDVSMGCFSIMCESQMFERKKKKENQLEKVCTIFKH